MLVDIQDEKGKLVRDTSNMAILSVDRSALNRDAMYKNRLKKDNDVQTAINKLESEVSSIKSTLAQILEILNSTRGS